MRAGARLKVKPLDHVAGGHSGVGRRYSLPSGLRARWSASDGRECDEVCCFVERYGKCVNNVSRVNALDRPRPKKRSFHGQLPLALG